MSDLKRRGPKKTKARQVLGPRSRLIWCRVEESLGERVLRDAEEKGETLSKVVYDIVRAYYGRKVFTNWDG